MTYRSAKFWGGNGSSGSTIDLDASTQVKVANLHRNDLIAPLTQDILGLEIPVRHALRMQEVERGRNVAHNHTRLALRQVTALLDMREQRSAFHLLEHHIELLLFYST